MKISQEEFLTFDDVLIKPRMSYVDSRQSVSLKSDILGVSLKLPVFSANMDTVTGPEMCKAMADCGGMGVLHRFWTLEDNVDAFHKHGGAVSVGISADERDRAITLYHRGAKIIFIDVANGASYAAAVQLKEIKKATDAQVVIGNFASLESIKSFLDLCANTFQVRPDAIKVGIGPGSACTTRIKTGIGVPQLSAIMECAKAGIPVIADGGMKTPGDIAKALAAGAKAVMIGGMLAGTDETPGKAELTRNGLMKKYRGSASKESYVDQNKDASWRTAEGESFMVPAKGPVKNILQDIEGGLKSAFSYVDALNLEEFQKNAEFIKITNSALRENGAHGKSS